MKLRSMLIQQERATEAQHYTALKKTRVASSKAIGNLEIGFEGPTAAFVNYSSSSTQLQSISASSLPSNCQLTNPFLLMLDGSTVQEKAHHLDPPIDNPSSGATKNGRITLSKDLQGDDSRSTLIRNCRDSSRAPGVRVVQAHNARAKLNGHYPESYVEHINNVLSSTESRRSSLASLASSWDPGQITITQEDTLLSDPIFKSDPTAFEFGTQEFFSWLSKGEEAVWKELVDDTQVEQNSVFTSCTSPVPKYEEISLTYRRCCTMPDVADINFCCDKCGSTQTHHFAILSLGRVLRDPDMVNEPDHFGNTPLYCAVVRGVNFTGIQYLLEKGARAGALNSFGETFMHLIQFIPRGSEWEYIDMLRLLESLNFPFAQRDFHGRTILHKLQLPEFDCDDIEVLAEIFDVFKPDFAALDNGGRGVLPTVVAQDYLSRLPSGLLRSSRNTVNPLTWIDMWNMPEISQIDFWLHSLDIVQPTTWIDGNGETILNAILKLDCWENEKLELRLRDTVQELLSLGVEFNMRDRDGDTALAIATKRGFRPVVSILLNAGANPNTRNYKGTGILSQATLCRIQAAKEGNDRLHAMILSCCALLVDSGAKVEPTQREEWLSISARNIYHSA